MPAWETLTQPGAAKRLVAGVAIRPAVAAALRWVEDHASRCEQETAAIAAIPAPTFDEARRAAHVEQRMRTFGVEDVRLLGRNNVIGRLGPPSGRGVALLAHLDTVFAGSVAHTVGRRQGRLHGPSVGDNSAGIAGMLLTAEALLAGGVELQRPLWLVGNAAEEGLGDLQGARETMDHLRDRLDAVLAIEGTMLGRLGHIAVGSRRLHVRLRAPGGHSWLDFGRPSAVHAAVSAAAAIAALPVPGEPRTTFNIGRIEGGEGVNVLATRAEFLLDLRSLRPDMLEQLEEQVRGILRRTQRTTGVAIEVDEVGDRPAGFIPRGHPLVEICAAAIERVGLRPEPTAGSTDANVPLSAGIPAIALGVTRGGGIHSQDEWIEIAPMVRGVQQLVIICAALAGGD